jgi:hypothetical protein
MRNVGRSLMAILLGNLAYFFAMQHLPYSWRHHDMDIDFGLAVDAFCCVVIYIVLDAAFRPRVRIN